MTDQNADRTPNKDKARGDNIKTGIAVGIGSAAIVAALLYASKARKSKKRPPEK